jgi:hypothetical protein
VERFNESIAWLESAVVPTFPDLQLHARRENVLRDPSVSLADRLRAIRDELGGPLYRRLLMSNEADLKLYQYAAGLFAVKNPYARRPARY